MKYVILKIETYGLSLEAASTIHISALRVEDDTEIEFHRYIEGVGILGFCDKNWRAYLDTVRDSLLSFIGDLPVVGHNIDQDVALINKCFNIVIPNKKISLMELARSHNYSGSLKFRALCKHYKVPYYMHYNNVKITDMLFRAILES